MSKAPSTKEEKRLQCTKQDYEIKKTGIPVFIPPGIKVRVAVYRNLHKQMWSVKDRYTGRVIAHLPSLCLEGIKGCEFRVSQSGRERVLQQRTKNVHATVCSEWTTTDTPCKYATLNKPIRVSYNPYKSPYFRTLEGKPVLGAKKVEFRSDGTAWAESVIYLK
jgi:hypothetical protein